MPCVGELWMSLKIKAGELTEEPLTLRLYLHLNPESWKLRWAEMQRRLIWNLWESETACLQFRTLPETPEMLQATARWLLRLKTEFGPRMESAKCEVRSDTMVVAHSSHWLPKSPTPASYCALVCLVLKPETGGRNKNCPVSGCSAQERRWRRGGGQKTNTHMQNLWRGRTERTETLFLVKVFSAATCVVRGVSEDHFIIFYLKLEKHFDLIWPFLPLMKNNHPNTLHSTL